MAQLYECVATTCIIFKAQLYTYVASVCILKAQIYLCVDTDSILEEYLYECLATNRSYFEGTVYECRYC